ncbi:unnamed protein product, partial [Prorocentrum cordatum]
MAARFLAERPPLEPPSALETIAIRSSTVVQYQKVLEGFVAYCSLSRLDWKDFGQLDAAVTRFLNRQFMEGLQGSWKAQLPRATRSSIARLRRVPAMTRVPLPYFAAAALAGMLAVGGRRRMAIWTLLTFSCCLRPFEAQGLRGASLARPVGQAAFSAVSWALLLHPASGGRPGKTGLCSESAVIDLDQHLWPLLAGLRGAVTLDQSLWDFTFPALREQFSGFANAIELRVLDPTMYSLRRGGAAYLQGAMTRAPDWVFLLGRIVHANLLEIVELGPGLQQCSRVWQLLPEAARALIAAKLLWLRQL